MRQADTDKTSGISVDVEDLINVRSLVAGFTRRIAHRPRSELGVCQANHRGRGMDYEESRAYVAGDDLRNMDWRVMARSGEAHTKVYAEEKQRAALLAIDLSPSMYFGTELGFKSWAAAHTAAHIGWLAKLLDDQVGGLIVAPQVHCEVKPSKGHSSLMRLFHALSEFSLLQLSDMGSESRLISFYKSCGEW